MIITKFTCKKCKKQDIPVACPHRTDYEDVKDYIDRIMSIVKFKHTEISPRCKATKVDLKIPIPEGSEYVGQDLTKKQSQAGD